MNYILLNIDFYRDAEATGHPLPPRCGFHSTRDKFFVDGEHPDFPNLLRIAVLRYSAGCKKATKAMKWFAVQITHQDRQKLLKRFNDPVLESKNPAFGVFI
jgi:hypothetical protein